MATATAAQDDQINITQLSAPQLQQLRQTLVQEVQQLSQNYSAFKAAQARLNESETALQELKPENAGKDVLVPMTQSLYVPGKLTNVETVLVDVGTGYYFEKSASQARSYFARKAKIIQENADSLEKIIRQKKK